VVSVAAVELDKAETLSRAGDGIDVAAYASQHQRMRTGMSGALRQQSVERSRFEESERALAAAKARYAQSRGEHVAAIASPPSR
jgi:hypothetical protein